MSILGKLLIIFAFAVSAVAFMVYNGVIGAAESAVEPPKVLVRVAAQDLQVGTFLDDAKAPLKSMSAEAVAEDYVTDAGGAMVGAVIIAPVPAGQPVRRGALLAPGQDGFLAAVLKPGFRAVSLAVDAVSGNAGLILPGDRVDLLLTQQLDPEAAGATDPGRRWASETILRNVRVIAVDQKLGSDLAARTAEDAPAVTIARTITLEVPPEGAEIIAVARNLGAISLTLRSLILQGPDGARPDAEADGLAPQPTWASDVSAVTRAALGRETTPEPIADATPIARAVKVLRGVREETLSQ